MSNPTPEREYLIIPTQQELDEAWEQYRGIIARRAERGQVVADGEIDRVEGNVNAEHILDEHPHIREMMGTLAASVSVNVEEGRLTQDRAFELGAKFILEMFAIATTAYEVSQIEGDLDN